MNNLEVYLTNYTLDDITIISKFFYNESMKTKLNSISFFKVLSLTVILNVSSILFPTSIRSQTTNQPNTYPQEVIDIYIESCSKPKDLQEMGLSYEDLQRYCRCTINKFQEQYTFEEFFAMSIQLEKDKKMPPEFMKIVGLCISDLSQ